MKSFPAGRFSGDVEPLNFGFAFLHRIRWIKFLGFDLKKSGHRLPTSTERHETKKF
jgi:hypothetical protein